MPIPDNTIRELSKFHRAFIGTVAALSHDMTAADLEIAMEPVLRAIKSDLYAFNPAERRRARILLREVTRIADAAMADTMAAVTALAEVRPGEAAQ